jgi:hypothetical protein
MTEVDDSNDRTPSPPPVRTPFSRPRPPRAQAKIIDLRERGHRLGALADQDPRSTLRALDVRDRPRLSVGRCDHVATLAAVPDHRADKLTTIVSQLRAIEVDRADATRQATRQIRAVALTCVLAAAASVGAVLAIGL